MKIWIWFVLSCKRQLKNPFFAVMLILMPFLLLSFKQLEQNDSGKIRIAVYNDDLDTGIAGKVIDELVQQQGMFQFYECRTKEMLQAEVAARRAECGYLLKKDLQQKLDDRDFKRSIEVYSAPSTIAGDLSKEVVFSYLIEVYGENILEQFVTEYEIFTDFDQEQIRQEIKDMYEKERSSGSTFSFVYQTLDTQLIKESVGKVMFPVRGMVAVYLFTVGLFATVTLVQDEKKGLFIPLTFFYRFSCRLVSLAAPIILAAISALVTLFTTGNWTSVGKEITAMLIYLLAIIVFVFLYKMVIRKSVLLCSLIPFFILGSLIFCPVFTDVTKWLPQMTPIRNLFLPFYYLRLF